MKRALEILLALALCAGFWWTAGGPVVHHIIEAIWPSK